MSSASVAHRNAMDKLKKCVKLIDLLDYDPHPLDVEAICSHLDAVKKAIRPETPVEPGGQE